MIHRLLIRAPHGIWRHCFKTFRFGDGAGELENEEDMEEACHCYSEPSSC
jgi:hypothetical protein